MDSPFPSKYEMFGRILDGQSPQMRELIQYAITILAVEDGTAELIGRHVIDAREHHTFRTTAGETFTLVKPDVSSEELERVREMAREVLRAGSADDPGNPS
jgi:hypothetical protein